MQSVFKALCLSHQTAPIAVREAFALSEDQAKAFLIKIKEYFGVEEALVVSTCNRTEIYYVSDESLADSLIKLLVSEKALGDAQSFVSYFQILDLQADAVLRLFEVSMGLHSKVVGDLQIPNQVKQAYQWCADMQMAGPFLHRLMHTIFFANKRVAQETAFRDGAASVSYAAVALTEEVTRNLNKPKVLILGLGEIGTDVCKNIADKEFADITVVNRTRSRAEALAQGKNFRVADFENVATEIAQADVVISSIRLDTPLITREMVAQMEILSYKTFIDLSVPRSVEENLESITGVLVYNIDTLRERADEALQKRLAAVPHVRSVIGEAIAGFEDWSKEMVVSPTIQKLKNSLEQIRKEEMARFLKNMSAEESDKIEKITANIVQRILRSPVVQLKAACKRGDADQMIDVLNELFNLEQVEAKDMNHR
jgi:glutamyl-tRNA reductase